MRSLIRENTGFGQSFVIEDEEASSWSNEALETRQDPIKLARVSGSRASKQMINEIVHGWHLRSQPDTLLAAHRLYRFRVVHHSVSHGDGPIHVLLSFL